jgi:hypothetical protein
MRGISEIFPISLLWSIFFISFRIKLGHSFDFSCAKKCAGRGKQMWGSVVRKGKDLACVKNLWLFLVQVHTAV